MFGSYYSPFRLIFSIGFYQYWMAAPYPTRKTTGTAGRSRRVAEQWLCRAECSHEWTKWVRELDSSRFSVPDFHSLLSYSWFFHLSLKRSSGFLVYSVCILLHVIFLSFLQLQEKSFYYGSHTLALRFYKTYDFDVFPWINYSRSTFWWPHRI